MVLSDREIIERVAREGLIEPFVDHQVSEGVVSYGLSSYGYDFRVANEFKVFSNVNYTAVDPKSFDSNAFVDIVTEDFCIIPPNSFALARTVEYFRIPRDIITISLGKCLTGDTRVVDAGTGDYLPIRDFVARQAPTTTGLSRWRLGTRTVSSHLANGRQSVHEVVLRSGLKLRATASHPLLTWHGWVPLSELAAGDRVAVARSCPVFGTGNLSVEEADLLGLMIADGQCRTPGSSPRYTTADPRLVELISDAARSLQAEVSPVGRYGYNLVNRRGRGGRVVKNRVYSWLEHLGLNVTSADKFVPPDVFRARRPVVARFLAALFSGDGSAYQQRNAVFLEYDSVSERLAYDVRHLLLRFGIFSLVRHKALPTGGHTYRVQITDREMIQRFGQLIGFVPGSMKQTALIGVLGQIAAAPKVKSNFDTLPIEAWSTMLETARGAGHSLNSLGIGRTTHRQSLPYGTARKVVPAVPASEFAARVDGDVVWDVVRSIHPAGVAEVFDIEVPEVHNFVANDVVVHNSTYARCGIILNVTPFEPGWEGHATLEISNTTPLPARIYANEGIGQVLFLRGAQEPLVSYKDRKGKYDRQVGIVLPRIR
jgi:deoxycytidine triphosphate deaminase